MMAFHIGCSDPCMANMGKPKPNRKPKPNPKPRHAAFVAMDVAGPKNPMPRLVSVPNGTAHSWTIVSQTLELELEFGCAVSRDEAASMSCSIVLHPEVL